VRQDLLARDEISIPVAGTLADTLCRDGSCPSRAGDTTRAPQRRVGAAASRPQIVVGRAPCKFCMGSDGEATRRTWDAARVRDATVSDERPRRVATTRADAARRK